ncbi:MAG TPA: GerMN domain-containing protein [Mycobacteriales bacterium]|nr:GerMN domain-containing protein [Mycobacteriales bacterium]
MKRLLLALLAAVALVAGCGVPEDDAPTALDRDSAPFRVFDRDVAPPQQGDLAVELWFVRGDRLVPVARAVELPGTPRRVLSTLFDGVTETERRAGLSSSIPTAVSIEGLEVKDGIAVVTLEGLNEQVQVQAFAQIVATLTGRPEIDGVRFRANGRDIQVPRGDSSLTEAPVDRDDYSELLGVARRTPTPAPAAEPAPPPAEPAASPAEPAPTTP